MKITLFSHSQVRPAQSSHVARQQYYHPHHPVCHRRHHTGPPRCQLQRHEVHPGPYSHGGHEWCEWWHNFACLTLLIGQFCMGNLFSVIFLHCSTRMTLSCGSVWLVRPWSSTGNSWSLSWSTPAVSVCHLTPCPTWLKSSGRSWSLIDQ